MGIFKKFVGGVGDVLGIGESATDYTRKAGDADITELTKGLDYLTGAIDPRLTRENEAADMLFSFFSGDPEMQQQFINTAKNSPFYGSLLDQGRQTVGATASATGGLRTGNAIDAFRNQDMNTLNTLVNQNLQGLGFFAQPTDVTPIAKMYGELGEAQANKYQAIGQAKQNKYGNIFDLGKSILGGIL